MRVGQWARSGGLTGLVVAVDGPEVALFDPADRQLARVPVDTAEPLPAGAVAITLRLELPLPHGLGEDALRRWAATLVDEVLRERAGDALAEAGLDRGPALAAVSVDLRPAAGHRCVAGHETQTDGAAPVACQTCGREACPPA